MPTKPSADFDATWYLAAYPDVKMSGLEPWDHYRRFGSAMGRPAGPPRPSGSKPAASDARPARKVAETKAAQAPAFAAAPIVDRPPAFDARSVIPREAVQRAEIAEKGHLPFGSLKALIAQAGRADAASSDAVAAYARMFALAEDSAPEPADPAPDLVPGLLRAGAAAIENAWYAEPRLLRLMLRGEPGEGDIGEGWRLRAYQGQAAAPAQLLPAGAGICLPSAGPVFWDLELADPYMPILIELADREDTVRAVALLPFPSLLPGGRHGAELKALQPLPGPVDAFLHLGRQYLSQLLEARAGTTRAVAAIVPLAPRKQAEAEPRQVDEALAAWLAALFQIAVRDAASDPALGTAANGRTGSGAQGGELFLPADSIPTIGILVRSAPPGPAQGPLGGPFLVVESDSNRPRWAVTLPSALVPTAGQPFMRPAGVQAAGEGLTGALPVHLAIAFRRRPALEMPSRPASPAAGGVHRLASASLDILLDASGPAELQRAVEDLLALGFCADRRIGVRLSVEVPTCRGLLDRLCGAGHWIEIARHLDLRQAASLFGGARLLSLSDRIELGDGAVLDHLWSMGEDDPTVGSVSCLLVSDRIIKKQTVLEPASGGLFPAGVSLIRAPRIAFCEPDVTLALQGAHYPVVANSWQLALWNREVLASLQPAAYAGLPHEAEIGLGLDLLAAGFSSMCTAAISARIRGPVSRCDVIDPLGGTRSEFARWEAILDRVTLLRELFS